MAALVLTGASVHSEAPRSDDFRLPTALKPIVYDLTIITHLEGGFNFHGGVRIKVSGRDVAAFPPYTLTPSS